MVVDLDRPQLPRGAWAALEGAFEAMRCGGLPCGAALVGSDGVIIARGRNHAYDAITGTDPLEQTPLAHAELNAIARVSSSRDMSTDTLWSTQQPCAMCTAAIAFCGIGRIRFLGADPAFVATADARAGSLSDPTEVHPELTAWAILANGMFLQPAIWRKDEQRLERNRAVEPETVTAAEVVGSSAPPADLDSLVEDLWPRLVAWADARRARTAG